MKNNRLPALFLRDLAIKPGSRSLDDESVARVEQWYEVVEPILLQVNKLVGSYLDELEKSNPSEVAFTKHRVKSKESLKEKLLEKVANQNRGGGIGSIYEEIGDLVGGRVVFYFEPDRHLGFDFFHVDPRFRIEKVVLHDALHANSLLHHPSLERLRRRIQIIREALIEDKDPVDTKDEDRANEGGYESLHLWIRLEDDLLPQRIEGRKLGTGLKKTISKVKIEIQMRSMLQDIWAQPEHRFSYEFRKSALRTGQSSSIHDRSDDSFRTLKLLMKAVERYHSSIWQSYQRSVPALKTISSSLGARIQAAGLPAVETDLLTRLDEELEKLDPMLAFQQLEEVFDRIDRSGERDHSLWSLKRPKSAGEWHRQKILLLFLGYLVSIKSDDRLVKAVAARIRPRDTIEAIEKYDLARQIYVSIKTNDAWFSDLIREDERHLSPDPLVAYRLAGVYLLDTPPNYYRGREELREAARCFEEVKHLPSFTKGDPILNSAHLKRRLAKFEWYLSWSRAKSFQYLEEASRNIQSAFEDEDLPLPVESEVRRRERSKILYDAMTIEFFRTVLAQPRGNVEVRPDSEMRRWSQEEEAEARKNFREAVRYLSTTIESLFKQYRDDLDKPESSAGLSSHGCQALAIWAWANGDLRRARNAISSARVFLRNSDERPLVRDVVRQIESFLVIRRPGEGGDLSD